MGREEKERDKEVEKEIETKIPLTSKEAEAVQRRIFELGGGYRNNREGLFFQRNVFLDTPDGRLTQNGQLLRVILLARPPKDMRRF